MNTVEWILHWTVLFGPGLVALCAGLFMYLCLNIFLWPLIGLYLAYIIFWPVSDLELDLWHSVRERVNLVLPTADYSQTFQVKGTLPDKTVPHLYALHPHGLVASSAPIHLMDKHSSIYESLSRHHLALHSGLFKVPFLREFLLFIGCVPATKHSMERSIEQGSSVWFSPGGTKEMEFSRDVSSNETWNLKSHTGYLKMAQKYKIPIVPLYSEGEQTLLTYRHHLPWFDDILSYVSGISSNIYIILQAGLPHNLRRWWALGSDLKARATVCHIGDPFTIEEGDTIEEAQTKYIAHVTALYKSVHPEKELTVV
jgi:1-acyl-sn-glycerol-3-phosphate acyltransferase